MFAERIKKLPFIADVITASDLQSNNQKNHPYFDKFKHSYHPIRRPDLYLQFLENYLVSSDRFGTSHGTPYEYDSHVPFIFYSPLIKPGTHSQSIRTVDIAPTIAKFIDLKIPKGIDGNPVLKKIDYKLK
jgi:hypothetical protein